MSNSYWWTCHGPFSPWHECPTRPDLGEVLCFYLKKNGVGPDEQVGYLMDLLDLQKSMVYNILKGEGLDAITRCRQLVQALKIPPPLLGIDARYYPIERHPYWWQACGYAFAASASGHPVMSEVVAYLRGLRTRRDADGRAKTWSQEDLGDATGLQKETIYRIEHDKNPLVLESMSRRAIVATALSTLAGDQELIIFRLFGLAPQAYGVPVDEQENRPVVHFGPSRLTNEILDGYQQKLAAFFDAYYRGHAQDLVEEVSDWLKQVEALEQLAQTTAQRVRLLALTCRSHELIAAILREKTGDDSIISHTTLAVILAKQAMTLPQAGEHALLTLTHELVAAALLFRASTLFEFELFAQAQTDIDRALNLLPELRSKHLKVHIVAAAGLMHAYTAQSEVDRTLVLSSFNQATQLYERGQCQRGAEAGDEHFMHVDRGLLCLYKAMALCAPPLRGTTADVVRDLLETARAVTPPERPRHHALIAVFLALDAYATGDYQQAIESALDALEKSRQVRSHAQKLRILALYEQLLKTNARDEPLFSYW